MKVRIFIELEEGENADFLARGCRSIEEYKFPCNRIHVCPLGKKEEKECKAVTTEEWKNVLREGFTRQVDFLEESNDR